MAVMIVEPHDGYATWLANALAGLTGRAVRAAGADEAMAAPAAEGGAVLAALVGPTLPDGEALALAGRLQQGAPDVSVLLIRQEETGELLRQALRVGVKDVLAATSDGPTVRAAAARALEIARSLRGRLAGGVPGEAGAERGPGRVVTVFSSKGGCGKTFLSANLAVALAATGAEVALVDWTCTSATSPSCCGCSPPTRSTTPPRARTSTRSRSSPSSPATSPGSGRWWRPRSRPPPTPSTRPRSPRSCGCCGTPSPTW
jgi:DNA-binding NarL/FixJ family response regulator